MENIIEISHLNKSFQEIQAVVDLSFRVKEGELFAFLGVNGAGKSTTISILCGQLAKDSGQVKICGLEPEENIEAITRELGVVFQSSVLDGVLTVRDNLQSRLPYMESQAGPSGSAWMSLGSCWVSRSFWGEP